MREVDEGATTSRRRPGFAGAPRLPRQLVDRPRLVRRLDSGAPLTIVRGVGGAGKTVLMAEWARARSVGDRPGQWVSLRRQPSTRLSFWRDVVDAVIDSGIDTDDSPLANLVASFGRSDDPRATLVRAFSRLPEGIHLIIDNYERVDDEDVHLDLLDLLEHCHEVRVTLATRSMAGLDAALLSLRVDTEIVGPEALRFTDEEVAELVRRAGADASPDVVAAVQRATDGLALPVRAAASTLVSEGRILEPRDIRVPDAVVSYIAETVTHFAPDEQVRSFLLKISVPEGVSVALARELTGEEHAEEFLHQAESNGLGLWSSGAEGLFFRFSSVVRSALYGELVARLPEQVPVLRRRYAAWARSHGLAFVALSNAVEAGDLEFASRITLESWAQLLEVHLVEVVGVLQVIPLRAIRHYPLLAMVLGLGYDSLGDNRMRAIELFTLAIAASRVRAGKTDPAERFVLVAGESAAYRLSGRFEQAGKSGENALQIFEELAPADRDELERNAYHLLAHAGVSLLYAGRPDRALEAFRAAYSASMQVPGLRARLRPLSLIAGTLALSGEMVEAREPIARLDRMDWPEGWSDGHPGALYRLAQGFEALERFDPVGAQAHVDAPERYLPGSEHRGAFLLLQALIDIATHRHRAGSVELQVALERGAGAEIPRVIGEWLSALLAVEYLASGRPARAEAVLSQQPADAPAVTLVRALTALLGDDPAEALRLLNGVRQRGWMSRHIEVAHSLVRAAALLRLGNHDLAADITDETVALILDRDLRFEIVFIPDVDREALARNASEHGLTSSVSFFDSVADQRSFLPSVLARTRLTDREATVLHQLVQTGSTAEIASALFVSINTVKSQLRSLYRKLGVASREEALVAAAERGLLEG
ncbi:LuxR C-terminal-related transcriptional regulator [Herbiconiux sp. UC225_62]|uniref:LuxR C-terminal-related transcriptional regulator n=1 Tax=Herbiconiux sp. UC225_62 TaxID=3350168 RepID=UPI0036D24B2E